MPRSCDCSTVPARPASGTTSTSRDRERITIYGCVYSAYFPRGTSFSPPGSKSSGLRCPADFPNHRQKVFDSCTHNEARPASILRSDCHKWALVRFSRDVKYASATDLVVKVEQHMIRLGHVFLPILGDVYRACGTVKRLLMDMTPGPIDPDLCRLSRIAEDEIERSDSVVVWLTVLIDFLASEEDMLTKRTELTRRQN